MTGVAPILGDRTSLGKPFAEEYAARGTLVDEQGAGRRRGVAALRALPVLQIHALARCRSNHHDQTVKSTAPAAPAIAMASSLGGGGPSTFAT